MNRDLEEAEKLIKRAAELAPNDPEVAKTQQALLRAQEAVQAERKKQAEFQNLVKAGREAMDGKRFDDAIKLLGKAAFMNPDDASVSKLLEQAEAAKEAAQLAATRAREEQERLRKQEEERRIQEAARTAAEAQKKREEDFGNLTKAGRAALENKRFDEAVVALKKAGTLKPGDASAGKLLKQAEKGLEEAKQAAEAARKMKEEQDRTERLGQLLTKARAALAARDLDLAGKTLAEASRLAPKDAAVAYALQELEQARNAAAEAERKRLLPQYQDLLKAGQTAMTAKKYDDAIKAFTDASRLLPREKSAADALKGAQAAKKAEADAKIAEGRKGLTIPQAPAKPK